MNRSIVAVACVSAVLAGCGQDRPAPTPTATSSRPPTVAPSATPSHVPNQDALNTRLIAAAWANDVDKARELIEQGADVNAQDTTRQSAFLIASSEGYLRLLELTLTHGADVTAKDRFNGTALIRAAERGHARVCGELIQAKVPLDHVNNLGWTALHEAVVLGDGDVAALDTVRVLVAGGVDVTVASGRFGMTAAEHAEQRGLSRIARLLRAADVPRSRDPDHGLTIAARDGDADAAALALRDGAEPGGVKSTDAATHRLLRALT